MPARPWEPKKQETSDAYSAFVRYRDQADRSMPALADELGCRVEVLKRWSSRFAWVDRCRAWDAHLQAERDRAAAAEARRWAERHQRAREQAYAAAQALRAKATEMLDTDLADSKWGMRDAAALLKTAHELEAAALGPLVAPEAVTAGDADTPPEVAAAMVAAGLAAAGLDRTAEDAHGPF